MAQLKALTVRKPEQRLNWKVELVRMLYERKYSRQQIINLFRFIDWLISLPKELEINFKQEVKKLEEERMPYVTSIERLGREEGIIQGQLQAAQDITLRLLNRRFGEITPEVQQQLKTLKLEQLEDLAVALLDFTKLEDLHAWLETAGKMQK
jgi:flagellar biosynthesis/type III secretory pathway protein FliH